MHFNKLLDCVLKEEMFICKSMIHEMNETDRNYSLWRANNDLENLIEFTCTFHSR